METKVIIIRPEPLLGGHIYRAHELDHGVLVPLYIGEGTVAAVQTRVQERYQHRRVTVEFQVAEHDEGGQLIPGWGG